MFQSLNIIAKCPPNSAAFLWFASETPTKRAYQLQNKPHTHTQTKWFPTAHAPHPRPFTRDGSRDSGGVLRSIRSKRGASSSRRDLDCICRTSVALRQLPAVWCDFAQDGCLFLGDAPVWRGSLWLPFNPKKAIGFLELGGSHEKLKGHQFHFGGLCPLAASMDTPNHRLGVLDSTPPQGLGLGGRLQP